MTNKRGAGEGSKITYRAGENRYYARLSLGRSEDGRRIRRSFYGATASEVRGKILKARYDLSRGVPVASRNQLLAEFARRWLSDVVELGCRPKTFKSYQQTMRDHILPTLGRIPLEKLSVQDVQGVLKQKVAEGRLSNRSIAYIRRVLVLALNWALERELVGRNVAQLATPPPISKTEIRPLDENQTRKFLVTARGDRLEALYILAFGVGLRRGEICGLPWANVDLDKGALKVTQQLQRIKKQVVFTPPKSEKSHRSITLPANVITALRAHRVRQLEERMAAGKTWQNRAELVFTTKRGAPLDERTLVDYFKRILKRAELPNVRFHDARHTFATLALMRNVHVLTVSKILGHSSVAFTMSVYGHVLPSMEQEAAKVLDSILG
jgi:integrase